jgi:uncharacterized membrane protein YkvI
MKCCNNTPNNGDRQENKNKGHMSHMWMMALCCGAPIILLLLLPLIGKGIPGLKGVLSLLIPFICPVMMIIMIPMMFRKNKGNETGDNHYETKQIENKRLE